MQKLETEFIRNVTKLISLSKLYEKHRMTMHRVEYEKTRSLIEGQLHTMKMAMFPLGEQLSCNLEVRGLYDGH